MAAKSKAPEHSRATVAKEADGSVQITFTIPYKAISETQSHVLSELAEKADIPGFRRGKAPIEKVREKISKEALIEHILSHILPKMLGRAIDDNKLKLVMYPKYQLISAKDNEDWQVRAISAEVPEFELGDYKKTVAGAIRSKGIWTPGKGEDKAKEPTKEEKEQEVIKSLLEGVKISIPKVLAEEEVNVRLARLLERIEKLGLTLESYLASVGKTPDGLRAEYERQAKDTIALDLILSKIADKEDIKISEGEVDAAVFAGSTDPKLTGELNTPERRSMILAILKKRAALSSLTSLV